MNFTILNIPAAGIWKRDCGLLDFSLSPLSFEFIKDSDSTRWKMVFNDYVAFKFTAEEFTVHLTKLPENGSFYLIEDSSWIKELCKSNSDVIKKCRHYVLFFYNEVVEIISPGFSLTQIE